MGTPFIDLKTQYATLKHDIDHRMQAVLEHGQYIMGPEVAELEGELAAFCGAKHAITVANGTDALLIALMAMGVGPGHGIFVPAFTFTATAEVVQLLGAEPVFVDVLGDTFNMDPADLQRKAADLRGMGRLTPKGVIAVDLFGQPADYSALNVIAKAEGLFILADAAQSFGGSLNGVQVGCLAPVTATSFFPAKPLGCYGDGGALFTDDDDLAKVMRSVRLHGKGDGKYDIVRLGMNSRLDTLQAAVLLSKLSVFSDEIEARNRVAEVYSAALDGVVQHQHVLPNAKSVWAQFTLCLDRRDELAKALKAEDIPSAIYYPRPMHLQPAFESFGDGAGSLPVSEALSGEVLSLPMHPYLDLGVAQRIARVVSGFMAR